MFQTSSGSQVVFSCAFGLESAKRQGKWYKSNAEGGGMLESTKCTSQAGQRHNQNRKTDGELHMKLSQMVVEGAGCSEIRARKCQVRSEENQLIPKMVHAEGR